jgi:hypothetical protein
MKACRNGAIGFVVMYLLVAWNNFDWNWMPHAKSWSCESRTIVGLLLFFAGYLPFKWEVDFGE